MKNGEREKLKVGDNIREIREFEKNLKREYVAERLKISTRAYGNIENNITDITVNRLCEIADIFECNPLYIITYKSRKRDFYNAIHNDINGTFTTNQNQQKENKLLYHLQNELFESQRKRIILLEALLKANNIDF